MATLIDRYLQDAVEVDVDVAADRETVRIAGVMEHVEEAGIHSATACSLPPYSLHLAIVAEIERQAEALARALGVCGLMNVQMAVKDGEVFILEVNPRASRTVPFVAKAIGSPLAKIAARVMTWPASGWPTSPSGHSRAGWSRSRRRCSCSPASRASICCWGRR